MSRKSSQTGLEVHTFIINNCSYDQTKNNNKNVCYNLEFRPNQDTTSGQPRINILEGKLRDPFYAFALQASTPIGYVS